MKLRYKILVRDDFFCQKCGVGGRYTKIKLEVHHIDSNHENNDENNLVTLCLSCHDLITFGFVRNRPKEFR